MCGFWARLKETAAKHTTIARTIDLVFMLSPVEKRECDRFACGASVFLWGWVEQGATKLGYVPSDPDFPLRGFGLAVEVPSIQE
jgi:hypothetical protein